MATYAKHTENPQSKHMTAITRLLSTRLGSYMPVPPIARDSGMYFPRSLAPAAFECAAALENKSFLENYVIPTHHPCRFSSRKSTSTGRSVAIKSLEALDETLDSFTAY